jgi:hypothetical protein
MIIKADNYLINLTGFSSINNNRETNTIIVVNDVFNYLIRIYEKPPSEDNKVFSLSEDIFEAISNALKNNEEFYEIETKYIEDVVQDYFEIMGET